MERRLLVVDDEPKLLRAVADTLREEGYQVMTARSGQEALVRIAESLPDLIISDIRMPDIDGFELVNMLRSNPRTELIPIIFLSAKDKREDRISGFRKGVDGYVTKPFDPEELLVIIANIINRSTRISAELARLMNRSNDISSPLPLEEEFTQSELRVARLVSEGLSNKEIGIRLDVSVRTVEGHIRNILSKKGWTNRVEIVRYVFQQNIQ